MHARTSHVWYVIDGMCGGRGREGGEGGVSECGRRREREGGGGE